MSLFGAMDISSSALRAERVRAEVSAANMANAETTRTADGTPYHRQHVIFTGEADFGSTLQSSLGASRVGEQSAVPGGVEVAGVIDDTAKPLMRYEPGHPDADADGYVAYPDINPLTEMVDLMGATRAYGANVSALQAEKGMATASLDILK